MDLADHPDKEILSLQGFSKVKKLAGIQITLQKTAENKRHIEAVQCIRQEICRQYKQKQFMYVSSHK